MNKNEPNNNFYHSSKNKTQNITNSFKEIKKSSDNLKTNIYENNTNNINNRYENNLLTDKYNTQSSNNYQYNQSEQVNYLSGSRRINSEKNKNQIQTQRQYIQNTEIIYDQNNHNNLDIKINNIDNNQINERQIMNNKTNPDIDKDIINKNEIQNIIPSKSQDLFNIKREYFEKNEGNMSPDERILFQSATLDNIQEDKNIIYHSASYEKDELNNMRKSKNNSEVIQNISQNEQNNLGKDYEFSNPNEQIIIRQPIIQKEYDYNEIISQEKEQIKNNPEYEQTQQAEEEENDINEFQHKIITQVEHKDPRDKDSESEIDPKMQGQQSMSKEYQEIKNYINQNLVPLTNDRITFNKEDNLFYINKNNNLENEQESNNINKKIYNTRINENKEEDEDELENENNYHNEQPNTQNGQFFAIPLTPSKPSEEVTPYNKKKNLINKIKVNNSEEIIDNDDKNIDNQENNYLEELECSEFEEFSPNGWEKFYPNDDRFFKFPKEGIIHNQLIIKNNEIYKGDINNKNEKHGYGKYISPSIKRIGMWRRDKFTGWGREIKENGDIYEGKFVNGLLNGKGIHKNKNNKTTYIGDYYNSKRHGKGELYTNDFHYKGDFFQNKFEGKGKIEIYNEGEYEGDFKDNLFEGKGMLKWKNGRFYIGGLSKGKMNGYGEETLIDGSVYKGNFLDGVEEGVGKFINSKGELINVEFKNGEYIKNNNNSNNN